MAAMARHPTKRRACANGALQVKLATGHNDKLAVAGETAAPGVFS